MLRMLLVPAVVGGLALAGASPALAGPTTPTAGVHFTHGGSPTCTVTDLMADCTSELAGLGGGDIAITTSVTASATYTCRNRGGNEAPGQNKVTGPTVGSDPVILPGDQIKNGRAVVSGETTEPATVEEEVSGTVAGCPNGNWRGVKPVVQDLVVVFKAEQGGVLLFCRTGTVAPSGGLVTLVPCADGGGVAR